MAELLKCESLESAVIFRELLLQGLLPGSDKLLTLGRLYHFQLVPQKKALFMSRCCNIRWLLLTIDFLTYSKMLPAGAIYSVTLEMKLKYWCDGLLSWLMDLERYCSKT